MLYYSDDTLLIRTIRETDPKILCEEEIAQGWQATEEKYRTRVNDNASGKAVALIAEYKGRVAGYINVYINSPWGSFANMGYCEIVDFGVLEKYRRRGIGAKLMDIAEDIAAEHADTVYLGVGLHSGYGSAQRMYYKRGYVPDGKGVWYKDKVAQPYEMYRNDDDLNLYFSKKLR
ncbi:MAG: GNAT family N-acetyltransferase [Clostridiaceae bacterium]|nr:GNAT family N-acetyltransferase [Eubacteriales bacterium]